MAAAASTAAPGTATLEKASELADLKQNPDERWQPVLILPCQLTVDLSLPGFKVSDLLHLAPGSVLASEWSIRRDVPLRINGNLIGWSEFEVVGDKLAVRLTELV